MIQATQATQPKRAIVIFLPDIGSLAWLLIVENLLVGVVSAVGKWLSFGASGALIGSTDPGLLPVGAAGLLLLGYGVAFIAAGMHLAERDVIA